MSETRRVPIDLFFSYSHRDEAIRDELAKHLKLLERQRVIRSWHDRSIGPGDDWRQAIDERLTRAGIVLLLISADFIASDYIFDVEMKIALERHDRRQTHVVPIIIRPVDWQTSPFGRLQALPKDGKPITTYPNQDVAFHEISIALRALAETLGRRDAAPPAEDSSSPPRSDRSAT